jgi:hypothetical protein
VDENKSKETVKISDMIEEDECCSDDITEICNASLMDMFAGGLSISMPNQKIQYFRTNRKKIKNSDGSIKITKGIKKGVLLAFVDPMDEESVCIGYSMCHPNDKFDYQKGFRFKNLGLWHAVRRAEKYKTSSQWIISMSSKDKQLSKEIVKVPHSLRKELKVFIDRCSKYYKNKTLPTWAKNFDFTMEAIGETKVLDI